MMKSMAKTICPELNIYLFLRKATANTFNNEKENKSC